MPTALEQPDGPISISLLDPLFPARRQDGSALSRCGIRTARRPHEHITSRSRGRIDDHEQSAGQAEGIDPLGQGIRGANGAYDGRFPAQPRQGTEPEDRFDAGAMGSDEVLQAKLSKFARGPGQVILACLKQVKTANGAPPARSCARTGAC